VLHLNVAIAVVALFTSCFASTDSETGRVVGIISSRSRVFTIEAPDTVRAGVAFGAVVNTFGSSTCTMPDGVELMLGPAEARVVPYDLETTPGEGFACTADLAARPHPVELRFTEAGLARIVAAGTVVDEESRERKPGEVTKTVVVVP
jgi:hypothetical protein